MKKYIFVFFASLMATVAMAQELTEQQQRKLRHNVLNLVEKYAWASSLSNEERIEEFKTLFADPSMMIYNDLLGLSSAGELSVMNYVSKLTDDISNVRTEIRNLRRGEALIGDDGTWQMPVEFDKRISYSTSFGIYFESYEYYNADYQLTMQVAMDPKTEKCYIVALEGRIESRQPRLSSNYTVLSKRNDQDLRFTYRGKPVHFNQRNQMIVSGSLSKDNLTYEGHDDFKVIVDKKEDGVRMVHIDYIPKPFRVRLHASPELAFNKLDNAPENVSANNNIGVNFGLDFGYVFLTKKKFSVGAFVGVGLSKYSVDIDDSRLDKHFGYTDYDIDEDKYTRNYENVGKISQTCSAIDLTIPIYFDVEYHVNRSFSLYGDVGAKILLNMNSEWEGETSGFKVSGLYTQYNNLIFTKALEGFGSDKSSSSVEQTALKTSGAILLGLGARYNISQKFSLEAGIQGLIGFNRGYNKVEGVQENLIHYSPASDGEKTEVMTPLLQLSDGLKQNALQLHLGLIYKF